VFEDEPANGCNDDGRAGENAKNLQDEAAHFVGDIKCKNPQDHENHHRGVGQIAGLNLVKKVHERSFG